jgi:hypothetical protein
MMRLVAVLACCVVRRPGQDPGRLPGRDVGLVEREAVMGLAPA